MRVCTDEWRRGGVGRRVRERERENQRDSGDIC